MQLEVLKEGDLEGELLRRELSEVLERGPAVEELREEVVEEDAEAQRVRLQEGLVGDVPTWKVLGEAKF